MNSIFVEAESFKNKGGWVVDTLTIENIHSAYLMAHGLGVPVEDAFTNVEIQASGKYYIWALTRDWTAVWNVKDSLGKFSKLSINDSLGVVLRYLLPFNAKTFTK